jgi:predicted nucleotidyltransferase
VTTEEQIERALDGVRDVLGADLLGAYLFGSAARRELRPRSDLDVFAVTTRPTTLEEKRRLVEHLLTVSGGGPRPIELTIVVQSDVRPWRHPPTMDFQYGEWLRREFESGNLEPSSKTNPDLASLVTMVLLADRPLVGPPPGQLLDPVPRRDYLEALAACVRPLLDDLETDTRNVLLTLARIWVSVATGEVLSKDEAAEWALARLPEEHRPVLARARSGYLGEEDERWDDVQGGVRACADYIAAELRRSSDFQKMVVSHGRPSG